MPKWTPDDHGCIYDEAGCFARLTPNKAERLASRHNADIDALTAERDELQRRLDAVQKDIASAMRCAKLAIKYLPACDYITDIDGIESISTVVTLLCHALAGGNCDEEE